MAHQYYGDDGLILTSITKENFDSGLSRVDCIYKCRTTRADDLELELVAGFRLPERPDYIIRENAKRKDETDGFTTFTVSGFYGTLQISGNGTIPIPSVLGAVSNSINLVANITSSSGNPPVIGEFTQSFSINLLSDTITKKFTLAPNVSVTTLPLPDENLTYRILKVTPANGDPYNQDLTFEANYRNNNNNYSYFFFNNTLVEALNASSGIINVNRSNFGNVDEVTVTWGLDFGQPNLSIRQYT